MLAYNKLYFLLKFKYMFFSYKYLCFFRLFKLSYLGFNFDCFNGSFFRKFFNKKFFFKHKVGVFYSNNQNILIKNLSIHGIACEFFFCINGYISSKFIKPLNFNEVILFQQVPKKIVIMLSSGVFFLLKKLLFLLKV